ncbi:MAG: translation initiation factor IF-2 subunit beta [Thermoplasmata archaeon]|nr:translation initiation factor IF-2 subunit beta [Thermoplasmata archaeon]
MSSYDYEALLKRAKANLPEHTNDGERFQMPEPDLFIEGKNTVFRNFADISESFRRDPDAIMAYLLRELGTAGNIDGRRAIFKSRLGVEQVKTRLKAYLNTYVLCSECGKPDSKLVKEGRILILECEACGAHRPVKVPRAVAVAEGPALVIGNVYEVLIQDLGKKGDGIAKVDKYIIFVPGTTKGTTVKVKINNISGTSAFGQLVTE